MPALTGRTQAPTPSARAGRESHGRRPLGTAQGASAADCRHGRSAARVRRSMALAHAQESWPATMSRRWARNRPAAPLGEGSSDAAPAKCR